MRRKTTGHFMAEKVSAEKVSELFFLFPSAMRDACVRT